MLAQNSDSPCSQSERLHAKECSASPPPTTPSRVHQLAASSCVQKWFDRVMMQCGNQ